MGSKAKSEDDTNIDGPAEKCHHGPNAVNANVGSGPGSISDAAADAPKFVSKCLGNALVHFDYGHFVGLPSAARDPRNDAAASRASAADHDDDGGSSNASTLALDYQNETGEGEVQGSKSKGPDDESRKRKFPS
jgi:hypothetical protein